MPGWLSSGNIRPASSKIMSPLHSKAVMFLPMASRPPSGMIFSFAFVLACLRARRAFGRRGGLPFQVVWPPLSRCESCGRLRGPGSHA